MANAFSATPMVTPNGPAGRAIAFSFTDGCARRFTGYLRILALRPLTRAVAGKTDVSQRAIFVGQHGWKTKLTKRLTEHSLAGQEMEA